MERKTDLECIKNYAKRILNVPVLETDLSPMIVSHPFTKCGILLVPFNDEFLQLDITRNADDLEKWKQIISKQIEECNCVQHIFYLLNDSYRLMFVNDVAKFLSDEDFGELLGDAWVTDEYANEDANVSKKQVLKLFKSADKKSLMTESELETYNNLDDTLVVYRGLSSGNKKNVNALSWTINFAKAKWFAERWGKGSVYAGTIAKKDVMAYFDRRSEDEVIVDFNKLQNVKVVKRPQPNPNPQEKIME